MYHHPQFTNAITEQLNSNWSAHQCAINKKQESRDWLTMQDDIIRLIMSKLRFYPHHRNFASTSKEWYRITKEVHGPFQDGFPFLLLPYNYQAQTCTLYDVFNSEKHEFHFPELSGKFVHASSNGWIVTINDSDFDLNLINPLTKEQIKLPKPIYAIEDHEEKFPQWEKGEALHPLDPFSRYNLLTKLVVSQDGKMVASIMVTLDVILICRIGADSSWTIIEEEEISDYLRNYHVPYYCIPPCTRPRPDWFRFSKCDDMVFFEGNLYVVDQSGVVIIADLNDPDFKTRYVKAPKYLNNELFFFTKYLVECCGNLLLLCKKGELSARPPVFYKTCIFEVYKFEKDTESWSRVYELGGKSIFIGLNGSVSVSPGDFVGCRSNCIYFANNYHYMQESFQIGYQDDNGVFCLEDGSVEMFNISHSVPYWVTPPMWLQYRV